MLSTVVLRKLLLISLAATAYAATTRYNTPLPDGAMVLDTEKDLREFTASHPDVDLETANGGYTIKEPNGPILAYVGDNLSNELDGRMKSLELYEKLSAEKGVSENDVSKVFETARGCSHPHCVFPGVPGKCAHYSGCYICSHGHRCI
ncbi:hypothetical protein BDV38DRAFT_244817 [Aspergillus pseudotamarii]|uniref:Uncharacterized protein n=1 Tax=Aspergillus pseudotamarii TaxID=132259 RepID=A0A5N6SU21_ASPPS|nr:uncharacterized protein BDV38DRAFT_244817 [Aspergillus pseudotamarii]KAE8138178.1 hypothetical protein BDV38DRAFT_244817 [Aspergillus pseudotamarii]